MLQIDNQTPFQPFMTVLPDRAGVETLHVVVKATLNLRPRLSLAPVQVPVTLTDEYYGEPADSSLRQASEVHIGKPGTDVLLVGQAWVAEARSAPETWVRVAAAERQKSIRVVGERVWLSDGTPSAPQPFQSMPLLWERAFGGAQVRAEGVLAEERNPVGVGFVAGRRPEEIAGQPLPNLEDPAQPLRRAGEAVTPACFAPSAAHWLPRRGFAGTYDAQWQRRRAPFLPFDFDPRFLQCAAPELTFDRHLQGGEPFEVHGATPEGPVAFLLPDARLRVDVRIDGALERPPVQLETVWIEPEENRMCLSWRAAQPCERGALRVERVTLTRRPGAARS